MPASYDAGGLFVFEPELDIGLRAGAFDGYGQVTGLDLQRKRAALETWMSNVRHEATGDSLAPRTGGSGYLDWFAFDLEDINIRECKARLYWSELRQIVNLNNDASRPYDDPGVKTKLELFNQYWNSEHRQVENSLTQQPYTEGNKTWRVVHANQQPGLVRLFAAGILAGNLTAYAGHSYSNQQGRGGMLPSRPRGYWAYDYATGNTRRGAARVVLGPTKSTTDLTREVWFTDNHYSTFVRVVKGHALVRGTT